MAIGLHGSLRKTIDRILASEPLPGPGQYHFEGHGVYLYQICADAARGASVAFRNAVDFAERKYPEQEIGCIAVKVDTRNALDLQHPAILDAQSRFHLVLERRLTEVGLRLEHDSELVRPRAHLSID